MFENDRDGDAGGVADITLDVASVAANTSAEQTFTVISDADSASGTGIATLTIAPPMITSGPYQTVTAALNLIRQM